MIIKLANDCRILGEDGVQFTLQSRKVVGELCVTGKPSKRAGEERWSNMGYYPTLATALLGAMKYSILGSDQELTAKKLHALVTGFEVRVKSLCEGILTAAGAADLEGAVEAEDLEDLFSDVEPKEVA